MSCRRYIYLPRCTMSGQYYHSAPATPLHLQPQGERKVLHITAVHIFAAQGVQKDQAIELADGCKMCSCPITGTQAWRGIGTSSYFLPWATVPLLAIIALPYAYLGLMTIMFFPRYTLHCFSPVWQLQRSAEEAAQMNAFAHHINS